MEIQEYRAIMDMNLFSPAQIAENYVFVWKKYRYNTLLIPKDVSASRRLMALGDIALRRCGGGWSNHGQPWAVQLTAIGKLLGCLHSFLGYAHHHRSTSTSA